MARKPLRQRADRAPPTRQADFTCRAVALTVRPQLSERGRPDGLITKTITFVLWHAVWSAGLDISGHLLSEVDSSPAPASLSLSLSLSVSLSLSLSLSMRVSFFLSSCLCVFFCVSSFCLLCVSFSVSSLFCT